MISYCNFRPITNWKYTIFDTYKNNFPFCMCYMSLPLIILSLPGRQVPSAGKMQYCPFGHFGSPVLPRVVFRTHLFIRRLFASMGPKRCKLWIQKCFTFSSSLTFSLSVKSTQLVNQLQFIVPGQPYMDIGRAYTPPGQSPSAQAENI